MRENELIRLVHKMEEHYGSLSNTPESSMLLRQAREWVSNLPKEQSREAAVYGIFDYREAQRLLDGGIPKAHIARKTHVSLKFLNGEIKGKRLNDELWNERKASYYWQQRLMMERELR
ncbi:hypothetical protein [Companilactobacillus mishanensis]|uniref:hypothetical protein n=1 Tax=Companilactobacillus mishanensis TaxID=2486008 RepID=UPI0012D4C86F|nr:hypothetical protein [Companilactobacillus mishanensis]MQS88267.1 hypothetical protein [Companilactobacillus mishanensis]